MKEIPEDRQKFRSVLPQLLRAFAINFIRLSMRWSTLSRAMRTIPEARTACSQITVAVSEAISDG
jgi:hypothetical protein